MTTWTSLAQTGGAPLGGYRLYMNTGRDVGGPRRTHRNGDFGDDGVYHFDGDFVVNPIMKWWFWFTTSVVGMCFFGVFPRQILWGPQVRCPFGLGFPTRFSYGSYGVCPLCASKDVTALVYDGSDKPSVGDSDGQGGKEQYFKCLFLQRLKKANYSSYRWWYRYN
jgi:hypothetical protein